MSIDTSHVRTVKPSDQEIAVKCVHCPGETAHRVVAEATKNGSDRNMSWWAHYQVIQCLGCKTVSFRETSSHSEANEDDPPTECLYPPRRMVGKGLGDDVSYLPDVLASLYTETVASLGNQSPVLAGIGLRALVEAVCKDRRATGRTLAAKIDALVGMGTLTPGGAKILHQIRAMGNKAAHEATPHSERQLGLAMDIVEHLLKDVFILPQMAEQEFGIASVPSDEEAS